MVFGSGVVWGADAGYPKNFEQGQRWVLSSSGTHSPMPFETQMVQFIDGTAEVGGRESMQLWESAPGRENERTLKAYLYTEGEKVYVYHEAESKTTNDESGADDSAGEDSAEYPAGWYLLYDFGMQPGDEATVVTYDMPGFQQVKVRCVSDGVSEPFSSIPMLEMQMQPMEEPDKLLGWSDSYPWILGMGSTSGPLYPVYTQWAGGGICVVEYSCGDDVFYTSPIVRDYRNYIYYGLKERVEYADGVERSYALTAAKDVNHEVNGYECAGLQAWNGAAQDEAKQIAYVRYEGQKVYFSVDCEEWYLMYDFGMQPGDKQEIYSPVDIQIEGEDADDGIRSCMVECLEVTSDVDYEGYDSMRMRAYLLDAASDNAQPEMTWIRGLGSLDGLPNSIPDVANRGKLRAAWMGESEIFNDAGTGIICVGSDRAAALLNRNGDAWQLTGLKAGERVELYGVDGASRGIIVAGADGRVNLGDMMPGVTLVRTSLNTFKVVK
jgi:hypothetical protein